MDDPSELDLTIELQNIPQLDLTSVCGGVTHDRKVACETLAEFSDAHAQKQNPDYAEQAEVLSPNQK